MQGRNVYILLLKNDLQKFQNGLFLLFSHFLGAKSIQSCLSIQNLHFQLLLLNLILPIIKHHIINIYIQSMSFTSFQKEYTQNYQEVTETSSLNAPLHHPLEEDELPPQLLLDGQMPIERVRVASYLTSSLRRKSMDQPFSIIGYMERRIVDKRGRLYSETYLQQQTKKDYI